MGHPTALSDPCRSQTSLALLSPRVGAVRAPTAAPRVLHALLEPPEVAPDLRRHGAQLPLQRRDLAAVPLRGDAEGVRALLGGAAVRPGLLRELQAGHEALVLARRRRCAGARAVRTRCGGVGELRCWPQQVSKLAEIGPIPSTCGISNVSIAGIIITIRNVRIICRVSAIIIITY